MLKSAPQGEQPRGALCQKRFAECKKQTAIGFYATMDRTQSNSDTESEPFPFASIHSLFSKRCKKQDRLITNLDSLGIDHSDVGDRILRTIARLDFRGGNDVLAVVAYKLADECKPSTLRGLFYQIVSAGFLPSTDQAHYKRVGRLLTHLRAAEVVPYPWIVDSLRSTVKPSSWSGLEDFAETVRTAYRKDFWSQLDNYVHIFCEKDAIAGTLSPVTREYDVPLSPIRGYCSDSFAYEIGSQWSDIDKPIHAYYLGDFDPSGFDIERSIKEKLRDHCRKPFEWNRLAVLPDDFKKHNLIPLKPKKSDKRYAKFVQQYGHECAEVDAINPNELRRRVEEAITQWIPQDEWEKLRRVEELEKESFNSVLEFLPTPGGDL